VFVAIAVLAGSGLHGTASDSLKSVSHVHNFRVWVWFQIHRLLIHSGGRLFTLDTRSERPQTGYSQGLDFCLKGLEGLLCRDNKVISNYRSPEIGTFVVVPTFTVHL
jgi:hypothetical protein